MILGMAGNHGLSPLRYLDAPLLRRHVALSEEPARAEGRVRGNATSHITSDKSKPPKGERHTSSIHTHHISLSASC